MLYFFYHINVIQKKYNLCDSGISNNIHKAACLSVRNFKGKIDSNIDKLLQIV